MICYNKGYPLGLISSGSVFGVKCISTCYVMYAFYFLIKERQIISTFVSTFLSTVTYLLAASLRLVRYHYLLVISYFLYFKFVTFNF